MITRKQADIFSDSLVEAKRKEEINKTFKRLNFIYGAILGSAVIEQYAHSPGLIKQAVKSAQNSWQIAIVFSILLALSACSFVFLSDPLDLVIGMIVIVGGGMVGNLIKLRAIRFLNENAKNS